MKKHILSAMLALAVAAPLSGFSQNSIQSDPAYLPIDKALDLKAIPPQVNINLPRFLLKDALDGLNDSTSNNLSKAGIDLPDLLKDVKLIRVVVIQANETNRPALEKAVKTLRSELDAKWTPIVSVPEKNVGVYAMGDPAGEKMTGVAVLVFDGDKVVICNVVGHVSIAKLVKIASQSKKFPKDFLKQLNGVGGQSSDQPAAKTDDAGGGGSSNQPAEQPQAESGTK